MWCVVCVCTWDAFALDGLSDDGQWLVARLTQHLAQLLHTVAVHDDGLPAATTQHRGAALDFLFPSFCVIVCIFHANNKK